MFMLLERVDPPADPPADPRLPTPKQIEEAKRQLDEWFGDPEPPTLESALGLPSGSFAKALDEIQKREVEEAQAHRKQVRDSRFKLASFPDYEFQPDGTPIRVATRLSGPAPATGEVKPSRVTSKSRYYSLASVDGRITITDSRLKAMIASGSFEPADFFTIDDFPNVKFDTSGGAHSIIRAIELDHKPLETADGTIRRYRLYSKSRNSYVWFTDAAARRYNDGRCSLTTAEVPADCVHMGDEFPDFAVDIFSGQPYRIQSKRIAVYAPVKCNMRADGKFFIQNYAGKRVLFTPKQLLEYVGVENASVSSLTPSVDG